MEKRAVTKGHGINARLLPQIDVYIEIIQGDGSEVAVAINCATMALMHAGVYMRDFVTACTVGCIDGTPVLGETSIW